ncbi:signal peptidase I [Candidatus Curtissbacteria bacterium RIFCSPHIGHO2_01_FULL_41_44]|uniref:Signal peptidase I n=1 Tax=Candidatus Curtissbacteria bacterium RIFCSPLOWO2_01_FULL_42_50 TaxID=1797730 RepID=A0A1F5H367_9BACT|nr:MAG: signal peptidase I [Candidatus Curtissbacteria bacterium RIFCSPHIGHO2_02_FULL_42_58]OGD94579.1 MAG: signal peptidase I [Candidatus Curtissbacteria bacterium RIFCSPHIGHO2_01_FULL_41_44]OGD97961.1 MAG: signal peptidase I [Candidatus Curtissbacteria bacterium RIFCSPHIGHO2_12_FULL_42_33]OGD98612.1 MAG: signal peptidase I [Candidatus Curtissbacteria bacterium RIFCSPLOWO2_01_FULL_42_50]OGE02179.1 MAG: signal peptidase I [Candidatus Curtissbacteria bacterium RIFCSPLOWO2_12_FULL_41_16]OGE11215
MSVREVIVNAIKEIVQTALISLGIFFFVYIFLVQPHRIKGDSMMPNFENGELLLTEKVSYYLYKPSRGDVVVFKAPGTRNVDFIKRIIGLPGDIVHLEDGTVFINDQKLQESYETQKTQGSLSVSLSQNQYFVLGDNRGSSSDSRSFGPIDQKTIKGKAWLVYWPIFKSSNSGGLRLIPRIDYGVPDTFYDR